MGTFTLDLTIDRRSDDAVAVELAQLLLERERDGS